MTQKPLTYLGNPVLRTKCASVESIDEETKAIVKDLIDTLEATKNGIGIAAPQIGITKRIFLTKVPVESSDGKWKDGKIKVYINPKILSHSEEELSWEEGCLSIPGIYAQVYRPREITIEALDLEGKTFQETLTEFAACNFCHEHDHINGVLFIDRISNADKKRLKPLLKKLQKKYSS
ncbi:MAG: peptide deformylase [Chlamydiales bacterium]